MVERGWRLGLRGKSVSGDLAAEEGFEGGGDVGFFFFFFFLPPALVVLLHRGDRKGGLGNMMVQGWNKIDGWVGVIDRGSFGSDTN